MGKNCFLLGDLNIKHARIPQDPRVFYSQYSFKVVSALFSMRLT